MIGQIPEPPQGRSSRAPLAPRPVQGPPSLASVTSVRATFPRLLREARTAVETRRIVSARRLLSPIAGTYDIAVRERRARTPELPAALELLARMERAEYPRAAAEHYEKSATMWSVMADDLSGEGESGAARKAQAAASAAARNAREARAAAEAAGNKLYGLRTRDAQGPGMGSIGHA